MTEGLKNQLPPGSADDIRRKRLEEQDSTMAMWGWVAGVVVLALVLMFVFTRGQVSLTSVASEAGCVVLESTSGNVLVCPDEASLRTTRKRAGEEGVRWTPVYTIVVGSKVERRP